MRIRSGNPRTLRRWGTMTGAGLGQRRRRTNKKQRGPSTKRYSRRRHRRQESERVFRRHRQSGRELFGSIGSKTVDRAFQNLDGIAPALISRAIAELTTAGKEITDNAINQLIDIPKNRIKGAIRGVETDIKNKYTKVKSGAQKTYRGITSDVKKVLKKVQNVFD